MTPYYEQDNIRIFHGDCREILPTITGADCVITDPVWPNTTLKLAGADRPFELFAEVAPIFPAVAPRLVVHLRCDSDPRFVACVPTSLPFLRVCYLAHVPPHYAGRILIDAEVAYAFGTPPQSRAGRRVISGFTQATQREFKSGRGKHPGVGDEYSLPHPCPRRLQHVAWIISRFADGLVVDPFMGTGTTLLAAKGAGYPAIGIEIEERYCEIAASRLFQGVLAFEGGASTSRVSGCG